MREGKEKENLVYCYSLLREGELGSGPQHPAAQGGEVKKERTVGSKRTEKERRLFRQRPPRRRRGQIEQWREK